MVRSSDPLQGLKKRGEIMNRRLSEKGQIIVILALGMVAIIGITALAVDGTLLYNQRQIGRAHGRTPVTASHLVCRLSLEKKTLPDTRYADP